MDFFPEAVLNPKLKCRWDFLSLALLKNGNNTFSEGPPFPKNRPLAFFLLIFFALSFFQEAHIGTRNVTIWYFFVDLKAYYIIYVQLQIITC